jgi:hypothetical protein
MVRRRQHQGRHVLVAVAILAWLSLKMDGPELRPPGRTKSAGEGEGDSKGPHCSRPGCGRSLALKNGALWCRTHGQVDKADPPESPPSQRS